MVKEAAVRKRWRMGADMCVSEREAPTAEEKLIKESGSKKMTREILNDFRARRSDRETQSRSTPVRQSNTNQESRLSPNAKDGSRDPADPEWVHVVRQAISIEFDKGTSHMKPRPTEVALTCFQNVVGQVNKVLKEHRNDTTKAVFREFTTKKCRALGNIGLCHDKKFEYANAVQMYKQCYEAAMLVECDLFLVGNITNNVAVACFNNGETEDALEWFKLSLDHWLAVADGADNNAGSQATKVGMSEETLRSRRQKALKKRRAVERQIKTMRDIIKIDGNLAEKTTDVR